MHLTVVDKSMFAEDCFVPYPIQVRITGALAAEPIEQKGQLPAHFLVLMGKSYCLPCHFLLFRNKKCKCFCTRFASVLSFALHKNTPNLLSSDAFYGLKMCQNAFAAGALAKLIDRSQTSYSWILRGRFAAGVELKSEGVKRRGGMERDEREWMGWGRVEEERLRKNGRKGGKCFAHPLLRSFRRL